MPSPQTGGVLSASRQMGATLGAAVTAGALTLSHGHPAPAVIAGAAVCATAGLAPTVDPARTQPALEER